MLISAFKWFIHLLVSNFFIIFEIALFTCKISNNYLNQVTVLLLKNASYCNFIYTDCEDKSPSAVDYSDINELAEDADSVPSDESDSVSITSDSRGKPLNIIWILLFFFFKMKYYYYY